MFGRVAGILPVPYARSMDEHLQQELEATVAARRELGAGHDEHLIRSFLEKIDREIDRRVDERVAQRVPRHPASVLNPATIAVCIPIVAIAGGIGKLPGLIVAFAALAIVFAAALTRR
jgi:hypothetical protein